MECARMATSTTPNVNVSNQAAQNDGSMERVVAAALHEVPGKERDEALYDIHGVADELQEDEFKLRTLLHDLNAQLANIESKPAYDKAESQSHEYVHDTKLRLKFLRSEKHDTQKAAQRMVRHFEWKSVLFGDDRLVREVRWADFDSEELEYFRSSCFQMRPQRDCVGRPILCMARSAIPTYSEVRAMQRFYWYISMAASEIEEAQSKGVVGIWYYSMGSRPLTEGMSSASQTKELTNAVPLRHAAVHICYHDTAVRPFLRLSAQNMENSLRIRLKYHFGSHDEVQHVLTTFGIPRSVLPLSWWHSDSSGNQKAFIGLKQAKEPVREEPEQEEKTEKFVTAPGPFDVLLGRGKAIEESPGNLRFRMLIDGSRKGYDSVPRYDKVVVAQYILEQVKEAGGRFLKRQGSEGWVEVDDLAARHKVSHSFRNHRNRQSRRHSM